MTKKKLLFVLGTRPEAIKLAPLILAFQQEPKYFECTICSTGQHRSLLDSALGFFGVKPDFNLNIMQPDQSLFQLSTGILQKMEQVLTDCNPNYVFVQGDTSTAFLGALSGFYAGKTICHVEAGLRTYNKNMPFPEEVNRRMISQLADWHFAPTSGARENLLQEGTPAERVILTGNTGIDALKLGLEYIKKSESFICDNLREFLDINGLKNKKVILVTLHRRESHGEVMRQLMHVLVEISKIEDLHIVFPVHPNPTVQNMARSILGEVSGISLLPPQSYESFIWLMNQADLILTDSGGIQEEAHYLKKPLVILRDATERLETLGQGQGILAGTQPGEILQVVRKLLDSPSKFSSKSNLAFGDGRASQRIVAVLKQISSEPLIA